jgi:hypothetical protein
MRREYSRNGAICDSSKETYSTMMMCQGAEQARRKKDQDNQNCL